MAKKDIVPKNIYISQKKGETAQGTAVTTDALNLRSGAGTDYHRKNSIVKRYLLLLFWITAM